MCQGGLVLEASRVHPHGNKWKPKQEVPIPFSIPTKPTAASRPRLPRAERVTKLIGRLVLSSPPSMNAGLVEISLVDLSESMTVRRK